MSTRRCALAGPSRCIAFQIFQHLPTTVGRLDVPFDRFQACRERGDRALFFFKKEGVGHGRVKFLLLRLERLDLLRQALQFLLLLEPQSDLLDAPGGAAGRLAGFFSRWRRRCRRRALAQPVIVAAGVFRHLAVAFEDQCAGDHVV